MDFVQLTQKEHGKKEIVYESPVLLQKIMLCAFDEDGNFDGTLDVSLMTEDAETPKDKQMKDGFIEYINTITYIHENGLPKLKILNNRMDWNKQKSESKEICNDEKLNSYFTIASKFTKLKSTQARMLKMNLKGYEWVYVVYRSSSSLSKSKFIKTH